jgi:hypothetical protein
MSEWVSTTTAAAHFGVSERTILRRAAAGKLESRRETTARGVIIVVALETGEVRTGADIVPTGADTQPTLKTPQIASEVPTGADGADRGADTTLTAHLLDENRFLRGVIEQLQRDGAEVRAALRDALKVMPKAITSGAADSAPEPPKRTDEPTHAPPADASQNAPERDEPTTYDELADWLEKEMR